MEYTIEEFEKEFESATDDVKSEILIKALDNLDVTNPDIKNKLLDYRRELTDIRYQLKVDEDDVCNRLIDDGEYKLYECIKEVPGDDFIVGNNYYVQIQDIKDHYIKNLFHMNDGKVENVGDNAELLKYFSEITPIIFIIRDNGIGTLKSRKLFHKASKNEDFNIYFK